MPIYEELKQDGVSISYIADAGKHWDDAAKKERRLRKRFSTREEAEEFLANHSEEPELTGLLYENRIEFLNCYRELRKVNATISQATHYFIKHGAKRADVSIETAINDLMALKKAEGRKDRYTKNLFYYLQNFAKYVGKEQKLSEITEDSIRRYIFDKNKQCSRVTKNNIHTNLGVLFNYAEQRNHISQSPLKKIAKLKGGFKKPEITTPEELEKLLNHCRIRKWNDRIVVFVLIAFCGVRREEASKLNWNAINLENRTIEIGDQIAKNWSYRTTTISENAYAWLSEIKKSNWSERRIISANWESLLRSAVKNAKVKISKNALRHSYASYSLATGLKPDVVAYRMGHGTDTKLIAAHYRKLESRSIARKWWLIAPPNSKIEIVTPEQSINDLLAYKAGRLDGMVRSKEVL